MEPPPQGGPFISVAGSQAGLSTDPGRMTRPGPLSAKWGVKLFLGLKKEGRRRSWSQADTQRLQSCPETPDVAVALPPSVEGDSPPWGHSRGKVDFVLAKRLTWCVWQARLVHHTRSHDCLACDQAEDLGAVKDGGGHGCSGLGSPTASGNPGPR